MANGYSKDVNCVVKKIEKRLHRKKTHCIKYLTELYFYATLYATLNELINELSGVISNKILLK
jgi:hypothetical protein